MAESGCPNSPVEGGLANDEWLETLYCQHKAGLSRFVGGVLRDRAEVDDVVQTTFAKAVQSSREVRPDAIKSWLYRVAFHEALNRKRRQRVDRKAKQALREVPRSSGNDPRETLVRDEVIEQVREAMQELPPRQLEVVRMRVYDEKTFAQIAIATGMPLGTVLTNIRRALERLRQKLHSKDLDP